MANSMRCWALYLSVVFSLVRPTSSYGGPFHRAAALGHVTEVQRFVVESWQGKADINAKGDDEWTPLHFTAWKAHLEVCETLLQRPPPFGANVAAVTDYGGTALHLCAYGTPATEERLNVCRFLLDKAASVNAATKDGTTPIYLAALKANIHVLRLLLERGADVNALSLHRASVLQAACKGGNVDIVRDLLKHDVKVKHKDAFGMTALHTAARANISAAIAEVLVDNGAAVDARDDDGATPLYLAATMGHVDTCKLLLKHGARHDSKDDEWVTPLHAAARAGQAAAAHELIEAGANVNARTDEGVTPLFMAVKSGSVQVCELLRLQRVDLKAQADDGDTPLHVAARAGRAHVCLWLLDHGAAVDARDGKRGSTALHVAARAGHILVMQTLLVHGAAIDAMTGDGLSPLHGAASAGQLTAVALLIDRGANVNAKYRFVNKKGQQLQVSPVHLAANRGHLLIAKLLVKHLQKRGDREWRQALRTPSSVLNWVENVMKWTAHPIRRDLQKFLKDEL